MIKDKIEEEEKIKDNKERVVKFRMKGPLKSSNKSVWIIRVSVSANIFASLERILLIKVCL